MSAKNRGRKPDAAPGRVADSGPPPSYDDLTPVFCLHYMQPCFGVDCLDHKGGSAFAKKLQQMASMRWKELITSGRHGHGSEHIPKTQIRGPVPAKFQDQERFMVFRYHGKLPMAGVRINDVFHVLWIERQFGDLYDHG